MPNDNVKKLYESLLRDYEARDALLEGIPEVSPFGNPKREIFEQMMLGTINYVKTAMESGTTSSNFGTVDYDIFPLLRRVYPNEHAFDFVTVQPMKMSTGKVFWVDDKYGTAHAAGTPDAITENSRMDSYKDRTYSDNSEASGSVKKATMGLSSVTLDTAEKKIKSDWTPEAAQDAQAYLGLSMEAEHNRIMERQMRREIGMWIMYNLVNGASAGNSNWSSTIPGNSAGIASEIRAYKETICENIVDANNLIFKKKYVNANFMVGSANTIARLEKLEKFSLNRDGADPENYTWGRTFVGTFTDLLGSPIRVYKDPWFPTENKLLLGYKGAQWMDAGAFWAPYVPIWFTPLFVDVDDDFRYKRGAMTRYGKRADNDTIILDGDYYATVTITGS